MTDDLFSYPDSPGFKKGGTSQQAAEEIAPLAKTVRAQLLALMRRISPLGLTADQAADALGYDKLTVRPRMSELYNKGLVEPTGERRRNESGKWADVWRAVVSA